MTRCKKAIIAKISFFKPVHQAKELVKSGHTDAHAIWWTKYFFGDQKVLKPFFHFFPQLIRTCYLEGLGKLIIFKVLYYWPRFSANPVLIFPVLKIPVLKNPIS